MQVLNKYLLFSFVLLTSFLFMPLSVKSNEKGVESNHLENVQLGDLIDILKDLQQHDLLDGEVLIAHKGEILIDLKSKELGENPQFMIGSVSKQFFAATLLKVLYDLSPLESDELKVEDVKRNLNLPLSQFLPSDSEIWQGEMPSWANIVTPHHLLSHTSGIFNYTDMPEYENVFDTYHSSGEILKLISDESLAFTPGSKFSYSCTGYVLIAELIKALTSMSPAEYLQQKIFAPLELSSATNPLLGKWNELKSEPQTASLVDAYHFDPRDKDAVLYSQTHCEDLCNAQGSGSIIATAEDLLAWNQILHKGGLLSPGLYELLTTANLDDYGYGIGVSTCKYGTLFRHTGQINTYRTQLFYLADCEVTIIVLSNVMCDFSKIEAERREIINSLPDDDKKIETAHKILMQRYPQIESRGFEKISAAINALLSD